LQTRESLELWGEMTAGEFEERFRILNAGEAGAVELKQHAVSEILNAKKEGRISAIIAENESMSESFASEARRYRFLNLYTPDGLPRTAVLWMGAMLLDELTEDMLSRFD